VPAGHYKPVESYLIHTEVIKIKGIGDVNICYFNDNGLNTFHGYRNIKEALFYG